jgi:Zn-dependent protease
MRRGAEARCVLSPALSRRAAAPPAAPVTVTVGNLYSRQIYETTLAYSTAALLLLPMLAWSMNLFRVRGIQLAVHFSFFLLLGYIAWLGWQGDPSEPGSGGWSGLWWHVAALLVFFTCVVLHELGHSFTAMRYGVGVRRILLMPIGGMAEFDSIPREPSRELLITLAGPAVNFAIAALLWAAVGVPAEWIAGDFRVTADAVGFAQLVLFWNLVMGVFNLIPVFPMDGGRIFRALLAMRLPYLHATFVAATVGKVLAGGAVLAALFFFDQPHPLTAVLFGFIFFAGEMELRAVKRREIEEAHWRAVIARMYPDAPPAGEPPLLSR